MVSSPPSMVCPPNTTFAVEQYTNRTNGRGSPLQVAAGSKLSAPPPTWEHWSNRVNVPPTFTRLVRPASSIAGPLMPAAAKWNTTSAPFASCRHACASVTLPSMHTSRLPPPSESADALWCTSSDRTSAQPTANRRDRNRWPMWPAPPVTPTTQPRSVLPYVVPFAAGLLADAMESRAGE